MQAITKFHVKDALDNDTMKLVLQYKWESYGRNIFMKQAFIYILFALVFSVDMVLFAEESLSESLSTLYFDTGSNYSNSLKFQGIGITRIVLESIIGLFLLYYIIVTTAYSFFDSSRKKANKSSRRVLDTGILFGIGLILLPMDSSLSFSLFTLHAMSGSGFLLHQVSFISSYLNESNYSDLDKNALFCTRQFGDGTICANALPNR